MGDQWTNGDGVCGFAQSVGRENYSCRVDLLLNQIIK